MTPSPGHIHQLPVKVLYSLDGTDQSYVTVLHETQGVYIHPGFPGYASDDDPGPVGSTYLKSVAQGVCYASPECVPSSSALDFSVYNLDPSPRSRPHTQPFNSSNANANGGTATASASSGSNAAQGSSQRTEEPSWTGKGFLSWAMSEPQQGSTLVKGRLMNEYDFEPSRFQNHAHHDPSGSGGGGGGGGLEALMRSGAGGGNGRGWGLEVVISLKLVNPAGKGEYAGRREFERMLFSSGNGLPQPIANNGNGNGNGGGGGPPMVSRSSPVRPHPAQAPRRMNGNASIPTPPAARPSSPAARSSGPPPAQQQQHNQHQHQYQPQQQQQQQQHQQPTSALSSLPPGSSSSMHPSSSTSVGGGGAPPSAGPSRHPGSSHASARPAYRPPSQPPARVPAASASTSANDNVGNSSSAAGSTSTSTTPQKSRHSRQVTPPPLPRPKSPPPTTPHRRALRDLLQADGKMSPSLARELVNNPSLLALLKSVPAITKPEASASGSSSKDPAKAEDRDRSARDDTPTPTAPKTAMPAASSAPPAPAANSIPGGCSNCGTTETSLWRSKQYPDGTITKVCDDCGMYFNKNKRMRPKELWDSGNKRTRSGGTPSSASASGAHQPTPPPAPAPPHGVRQSPRLSRGHAAHNLSPGSGSGTLSAGFPPIQESPSKRRRTPSKPIPQPSPRMATRSSAARSPMQPFPFSEPPPAPQNGNGNGNGNDGDGGLADLGDIDLDAILAQLNGGNPVDPDAPGISLEDLFATADQAAQNDDALAEDMMKFLAGLENDGEPDNNGGGGGGGGGDGNGAQDASSAS